jgi:ribosomal protein S18 acetylase RimI-like enzyme
MLAVMPEYQRMGIGSILLDEGLREADRRGLQSMLGASPYGIGLYRKHGYVEFATEEHKLWEYERGEGMGAVKHVVMHRPPRTTHLSSESK